MRLTLDVAQFGGKGVVRHEDGTECGDMCWFCYKRNVQGGDTTHGSDWPYLLPLHHPPIHSSHSEV